MSDLKLGMRLCAIGASLLLLLALSPLLVAVLVLIGKGMQ
jgi:hypothetical protein